MIERIETAISITYMLNGQRHRPNGPARIWPARMGDWRSGSGGCLIGGIDIMDHMILKAIGSYTRCGLKVINIIKNIDWVQYRSNDKVHRPNGPAMVYTYGLSTWWSNGKVHRYYGPALMLEWHCHGNRIK